MTMPQSQKAVDGGKIKGAADVANVIEIVFITQLSLTRTARSTVHGSFATPPANMQTLATSLYGAISNAWLTDLAPLMATTSSFNHIEIRDMTLHTNPVFIATGTAIPGSAAGVAMPPGNAVVMTENIASRGKGMKGRVYLCGWATNADGGGGSITPATQTAVNNFGQLLTTAMTSNSLTPCVAQVARQAYIGLTGTQHNARNASHIAVTSYLCKDLQWDSQRRRNQS